MGIIDSGCRKQTVVAFAKVDGKIYYGMNECHMPLDEDQECPRKDTPTGTNYKACKEVCGQNYHSETDLIRQVGGDLKGAIVYIIGALLSL